MSNQSSTSIASLNDQFRKSFTGGHVYITAGIRSLGEAAVAVILQRVSQFEDFNEGNNPYHENDFGSFEIHCHKVFWKIDCFDQSGDYASPDPANPDVTKRVLTVMLASEY